VAFSPCNAFTEVPVLAFPLETVRIASYNVFGESVPSPPSLAFDRSSHGQLTSPGEAVSGARRANEEPKRVSEKEKAVDCLRWLRLELEGCVAGQMPWVVHLEDEEELKEELSMSDARSSNGAQSKC